MDLEFLPLISGISAALQGVHVEFDGLDVPNLTRLSLTAESWENGHARCNEIELACHPSIAVSTLRACQPARRLLIVDVRIPGQHLRAQGSFMRWTETCRWPSQNTEVSCVVRLLAPLERV